VSLHPWTIWHYYTDVLLLMLLFYRYVLLDQIFITVRLAHVMDI